VVRNEYERGENSPMNTLMKEVSAAAYQALPYHHATIGWRSDIENVPIEKLRAFYDTFYWPNNATAILVGDVDPAAALGLIKKYYGAYPKSPQAIPEIYTEEPEQTGPRRVTVKRPGQIGTVLIAHKIPNVRDADTAALAVTDSILGDGKNSRLYRRLVDTGLAIDAGADSGGHRDLSLNMVYASLAPDSSHDAAEKAMLDEIERVKTGGVTADEVNSAIRRYRAAVAYGRDGTSAVVHALNEYVAGGDWTLYVTLEEKVANVKPADVQRVARQYLDVDKSTTGWFVPIAPSKAVGSGKAAATS